MSVFPNVEHPLAEVLGLSEKVKSNLGNGNSENDDNQEDIQPILNLEQPVSTEENEPQNCPNRSIERRENLCYDFRRFYKPCI